MTSFVPATENFKRDLRFIVDDFAERSWVELLALLEFVGCRKMIKSFDVFAMGLSELKHLSDEASHAYLLKKLIAEEWGEGAPSTEFPFSRAGWNYFQGLDQRITAAVKDEASAYAAVSFAIERRVLEIYPLYSSMTRRKRVRETLLAILKDERGHDLLVEKLLPSSILDLLLVEEGEQWEMFEAELAGELRNISDQI